MEKLTRTQVSLLASYSSPFILLTALGINIWFVGLGLSSSPLRLIFLSAAFPVGFALGRIIYVKRSHVEITFDDEMFHVVKGGHEVAQGKWRSYKFVSIILDQFGRPDLRLYRSLEGDFVDLPVSRTNARPQEFRDYVQKLLLGKKSVQASLQVVEVS